MDLLVNTMGAGRAQIGARLNRPMHIYCPAQTPNGAMANVHRIHRMEIDTEARVIVNSYSDANSNMLIWQDVHVMPLSELSNGSYPDNIFDWLTSATGPFSLGQTIPDEGELEQKQKRLIAQISELRVKNIAAGVMTPSGRIDSDDISIRNIMGTYQSAVLSMVSQQSFSVDWRMSDNSLVTMNASDVINMGNAVLLHTKNCYERSWELKQAVLESTEQTIDTIDINSGWPEYQI